MNAPWTSGPAIGTFVKIPAPEILELLAPSGLDFVVLDAEHGAFDLRTISMMVGLGRSVGLCTFVRTSGHAPRDVQAALDAGAAGLLIPHVDSPQVARDAVQSCRFPPLGKRGGSTATRLGDWGRLDASDYVSRGNQGTTIVAQIESSEAATDVEAIGGVDGIDAVFIGPFDLALATGLPPGGKKVEQLIHSIEGRCVAARLPIGRAAATAELAGQMLKQGLDFVLVGNDTALLSGSARVIVEEVRSRLTGSADGQQLRASAGKSR